MTSADKPVIRRGKTPFIRRSVQILEGNDERILDEIERHTGNRHPGKVYSFILNRILCDYFKTSCT